MTEREIREVIRELCEELDRGARRVVRQGMRKVVFPSMLGAGLALSACSEPAELYGVPPRDGGADRTVDGKVGGPDAAYGVPWDQKVIKEDGKAGFDLGPVPPYMAPEAGPQPEYMAPDDAGPQTLYAAPLYGVPAPDLKS
jgi:hypothetical protein